MWIFYSGYCFYLKPSHSSGREFIFCSLDFFFPFHSRWGLQNPRWRRRIFVFQTKFFSSLFVMRWQNLAILSVVLEPQNSEKLPISVYVYLSIYLGCFPQFGVVADNTEETTKQWGFHSVLLAMTRDPAEFGWHCWSNTAHPPPSSTTYVASYMPSPLLPLPPGCLYKATPWQQQMPIRTASQSFATHS